MSESEESTTPMPGPAQPERWGARLFTGGCLLLAAAESYYVFTAEIRDALQLFGGLLALFLAFVPALLWARRAKSTLPVFEIFILTGANTYALPLLNGHHELANYSPEIIEQSIFGVVLFQVAAIATFVSTPARPGLGKFWREEVVSRNIGRWMAYGVALNTAYVLVSNFTGLIPAAIDSVLRAVFFGIGIISTFITSRRLGNRELTRGEAAFFVANLAIQAIGMLTSLYLVSTISLLLLALVGYVSASGRAPVVTTATCLVVLALLHNGKAPMRTKYWEDGCPPPTALELPAFYSEWIRHGLEKTSDAGEKKLTGKLVDRTSLFQMLCLVVNFSPTYQPFLYGETYADIPAQFVPRFFWPDKPLGHVSNTRLSVYYGLQTEDDTLKTTIGFGLLSEAYANFGFYGLGFLGIAVGFIFKKIQGLAEGGPLFSYGGMLLIILLAWSFQVEFTLSIWIASFYQASVAVLGIPFIIRQFFGK